MFRAPAQKRRNGVIVCGRHFEPIATVQAPSTSYKDTNVIAGHLYCYRVSATSSKGEGPPTAVVTAEIPKP